VVLVTGAPSANDTMPPIGVADVNLRQQPHSSTGL
jgi:hypothetical protein